MANKIAIRRVSWALAAGLALAPTLALADEAAAPEAGAAPAKAKKAKKQEVAAAKPQAVAPKSAVPAPAPAPVVASEKAEIDALKAQIKELAQELNDMKILTGSKLTKITEDLDNKATGKVNLTYANGRPALATSDGAFTMAFRMRTQLDWGKYYQSSGLGQIANTTTTAPITGATGRLGTNPFFRRIYFGVEGKVFKDWEYEFRIDAGSAGAEQSFKPDNVRVSYKGFEHFSLDIGQGDYPFTLDQAQASSNIVLLERSSPQTLAVGLVAGASRKTLGARYFRDLNKTETGTDSLYAHFYVTGDASPNPNTVNAFTNVTNSTTGVVTPVLNPAGDNAQSAGVNSAVNIHSRIGYRWVPSADMWVEVEGDYGKVISPRDFVSSTLPGTAVRGGLVTFSDRPEFRGDPTSLVSTGAIPAKSADVLAFNGAFAYQNYLLSGGYYKFGIERDTFVLPVAPGGSTNPDFEGYDVTATWVITGERRSFSKEDFAIGGVTPKAPFSMKTGGIGAWELVARYSMLDLNFQPGDAGTRIVGGQARLVGGQGFTAPAVVATDGRIRGGRQEIVTGGVTWYANSNIKFALQYSGVSIDRLNATGQQIGQDLNILAGRFQFQF